MKHRLISVFISSLEMNDIVIWRLIPRRVYEVSIYTQYSATSAAYDKRMVRLNLEGVISYHEIDSMITLDLTETFAKCNHNDEFCNLPERRPRV
jgi:hypothetical protein